MHFPPSIETQVINEEEKEYLEALEALAEPKSLLATKPPTTFIEWLAKCGPTEGSKLTVSNVGEEANVIENKVSSNNKYYISHEYRILDSYNNVTGLFDTFSNTKAAKVVQAQRVPNEPSGSTSCLDVLNSGRNQKQCRFQFRSLSYLLTNLSNSNHKVTKAGGKGGTNQ